MHLCISQKEIYRRHLLFILYRILQISSEQCKSETFTIYPDKRDAKLQGFTYSSFDRTSPRACFIKCIRRPRCYSYNYNMVHLTCEINLEPEYLSEVYFQHDNGYKYVVIQHYRGVSSNQINSSNTLQKTNFQNFREIIWSRIKLHVLIRNQILLRFSI